MENPFLGLISISISLFFTIREIFWCISNEYVPRHQKMTNLMARNSIFPCDLSACIITVTFWLKTYYNNLFIFYTLFICAFIGHFYLFLCSRRRRLLLFHLFLPISFDSISCDKHMFIRNVCDVWMLIISGVSLGSISALKLRNEKMPWTMLLGAI